MLGSVAFVFLAASSAPAASAAPAVSPAPAPAVKERKICVAQEAVTGSITPKRVCKTKAEWDALAGKIPQPAPGNQQSPNGASND